MRAARIAEAEKLGGLVERFAERIVNGRRVTPIAAEPLDEQDLAVATRNEKQHIGKADPVGQARCQRVAFQMIDGDERLVMNQRQRLGRGGADDQAARQARSAGRGDAIEIGPGCSGLVHGLINQAVEPQDMGARGDLRHDTAIGSMVGDLAVERLRQDRAMRTRPGRAGNNRRRRFVTARLDAKNGGHFACLARKLRGLLAGWAIAAHPIFRYHALACEAGVANVATGTIKIGTRGSPLALAQAHEVRDRLCAAHGLSADEIEVVVISTAGDRIQDRPLSEIGGKGLFTEELEAQLLDGRIDIAVHSSKDMPTVLPDGLALTAFLEREDPRDAFMSHKASSLMELPDRAVVGTSSLRRQALVRRARPDVTVVGFRGNVQTRMKKLADGVADATLLANAGLRRLGMTDAIADLIALDIFPPAPGQGAICIEGRDGDVRTDGLVAPLNHVPTETALMCERAFLKALDGSCRTPIAGHARIDGDSLHFAGTVLTPDGRVSHDITMDGRTSDPRALGEQAGAAIRERAGAAFFESWTAV